MVCGCLAGKQSSPLERVSVCYITNLFNGGASVQQHVFSFLATRDRKTAAERTAVVPLQQEIAITVSGSKTRVSWGYGLRGKAVVGGCRSPGIWPLSDGDAYTPNTAAVRCFRDFTSLSVALLASGWRSSSA